MIYKLSYFAMKVIVSFVCLTLLFSCREGESGSANTAYSGPEISDEPINSQDTPTLDRDMEGVHQIHSELDKIISYEIIFPKSPYPNEDKCNSWNTPRMDMLMEIISSLRIQPNAYIVNDAFSHFQCRIQGELMKGGVLYNYYFNAGGFVKLVNEDTTIYLGCEKGDTCVKYFMGRKFTVEEVNEMMEDN